MVAEVSLVFIALLGHSVLSHPMSNVLQVQEKHPDGLAVIILLWEPTKFCNQFSHASLSHIYLFSFLGVVTATKGNVLLELD